VELGAHADLQEVNLTCTGRDAMCWEVLNDEWVSHPIWAAEDAAPFMTHKKNVYEEALHKSEEERHEYDYHIEANIRTIALLEPLNTKIQTMEPEERAHFNLKAGIGGQSKSIYQRIIKKVYGKEVGPDVIKALHDNPVVTLPIVLERLKSKDEEWKKAQRDWNRVWREQDAKNFYRALDHQGVQFKANDKKTIGTKNLIAEAELRKREQENTRDALVDASSWRSRVQFEFDFSDQVVLRDSIKLVLSYLDRLSALGSSDRHRIEKQLQEVLPLLFMIDKDEFNQDFGFGDVTAEDSVDGDSADEASMADEDETASASAARKSKKGPVAADLRMKLLKQVGEKEGRGQRGSATPGPEDGAADAQDRMSVEGTPMTENGDRAETPLPIPADPAAVAEAVEKDRAGAEASEQTWVNIEPSQQSQTASDALSEAGELPRSQRKANFFTNGNYYVLIRLIQVRAFPQLYGPDH
jgi:paired amphipathic helix protein Sin3a